ncbi:MAG TPA: HD domain-containing protein [Candidatus Saccharimonadales bacterium]|nr:HD domain-containing protein [Candidatus Saccharimonadales bacterium]
MTEPAFEIYNFSDDSRDLYHRVIEQDSVSEQLSRLRVVDKRSHLHSLRVARIVSEFAMSGVVEFNAGDAESAVRSAALHDIGKLGILKSILKKDGKKNGDLTSAERANARQHPVLGFFRCHPEFPPNEVIPILKHHTLQADDYPSKRVQVALLRSIDLSPEELTEDNVTTNSVLIAVADHIDVKSVRLRATNAHQIEHIPTDIKTGFEKAGKIHRLGEDELLSDLIVLSQDTFLKH